MKICQGTPNLVKIQQNYHALYVKTYVHFILASDTVFHNT